MLRINSNINYYYNQTVQSNIVKKTTQLTAATAFYTLHGIKYTALFLYTAALSVSTIGLPIFCAYLFNQIGRWAQRVSNQSQTTSFSLQPLTHITHKIESIAFYIFITILVLACLPVAGIIKGAEYIEDIVTKISQMALDKLRIPVQLSISERKLKSILKEWENNALPLENREEARKRILQFYESSRDVIECYDYKNPRLYLNYCELHTLPHIFHYKPFSNITEMNLAGNQLTELPEGIGEMQKLKKLNLSYNHLSTLPLDNLPRSCIEIDVGRNRFSAEEIARCVQIINQGTYQGPNVRHMSIIDRSLSEHNISTNQMYKNLYAIIDHQAENLSNLEKNSLDSGQYLALESWLNRLKDTAAWEGPNKYIMVANVINYLEKANENSGFRSIFLQVIQEAASTCGDRVALSLLHLDIAYQLATIDLNDMEKLSEFLLRGCWVMDLLEECARQKINLSRGIDEIEVYLGYPIKLKRELKLPISQDTMLYFTCSALKEQELESARQYVMSQLEDQDASLDFLINHNKWEQALGNYDQRALDAIKDKREQAAIETKNPNFQAIENDYKRALKELSKQALNL